MEKDRAMLFIGLSLLSVSLFGQGNWDWWNEKVNWDGVTSWKEYLIISPSYLGPNALPVPPLKTGTFDNHFYAETGVAYHYGEGDKTTDLSLDFFAPLAQNRVGLHIWAVPVEYYEMDTLTRDRRRARDRDGHGFSRGDFYIGTYVQLLKNHPRLPDMLLTLNLKTASGTNLEGARFTDSPGYFFDFSTGRDFRLAQNLFLRPSAMTGFYSYQTNLDDYLQNDAVMYGLGLDLFSDKFKFRSALTGYAGYINNGDKPLVFRLTLRTMQNKSFQMKLFFEHGIHDFPYTTFKISTVFVLHKSEYFWFDKKSE